MDGNFSLRAFAFCILLGVIVMACVASAAVQAYMEPEDAGFIETTALRFAAFPVLVQESWTEAMDRITGREEYKYLSVPRPKLDYASFRPIASVAGVPQTGLVMRGNVSAVDRGWRLFAGAILVDSKVTNAVVLVDPDFHVRHVWRVNEKGISASHTASPERKVIHGLALLPDRSIVIAMDDGFSIQRLSHCGRRLWMHEGTYNHAVSYDPDDGTVWTLRYDGSDDVAETAVNEGAPARRVLRGTGCTTRSISTMSNR